MATHKELHVEWNMLDNDCNNWTVQDLQLAAELGRTLLERNEELETEVKQQQTVIDDQGQEIEFLTKQVNSMKEESSSRVKFYEQLESSICELERTNSQLSRKHEVDKRRIQSMCENIEYLERKCEELNVTLQSLRNEQGKKAYVAAKVNRSSYFSFGSDSSEEDNNIMTSGFGLGVGLFRRRSHSLQDLRDYTPSPDEFDSGNSNSPDLKTSETEFIDSLETRIEELLASRKKETDKVRQLETQINLLIQENANLQQQIVQINTEKEQELSELRRHLQDSQLNGSFIQFPLSSTRRNSEINSQFPGLHPHQSLLLDQSPPSSLAPSFPSSSAGASPLRTVSNFVPVCKRCSAEINILNLVNSIESDNVDLNCLEWEFGSPEDDMEFSSLEHELARATGTSFSSHTRTPKDNRLTSGHFPSLPGSDSYNNNLVMSPPRRGSGSSSSPRKSSRNKKLKDFLRTNPSQIDIEEMDYENSELFDIFFGHDDKDETGEDVLDGGNPGSKVRFSKDSSGSGRGGGSSSSTETDEETESDSRTDEDACLVKDRKPEFSKNKMGKLQSKKKHRTSLSLMNNCLDNKANLESCDSATATAIVGGGTVWNVSTDSNPVEKVVKKELSLSKGNPKFLQLPKRIPSDDEMSSEVSSAEGEFLKSTAAALRGQNAASKGPNAASKGPNAASREKNEVACADNLSDDKLEVSQKAEEELPREKEVEKGGLLHSSAMMYQKQESSSSSASSGYDSEYSTTSTATLTTSPGLDLYRRASFSEFSNSDSETSSSNGNNEDVRSSTTTTTTASATSVSNAAGCCVASSSTLVVPEYKEILQNLFSIFNNSKRKYPIPMYNFVQEARRQSLSATAGLIYQNIKQ